MTSDPFSADAVRAAYDAVVADYVESFGDDLDRLPLDRQMLDAAWTASGDGWVLEAGCGPAPAATYLGGRAERVLGVDLSGVMLAAAGVRNPTLRRTQADLRRLALRDGSCSLAIAYYSLQHVPRSDLVATLAELGRVLEDDGVLVLAMHLGDHDVVTEEFLGHRIGPVAGALYERSEIEGAVRAGGFHIEEQEERGPLAHEHPGRRLYVLARRRSERPG